MAVKTTGVEFKAYYTDGKFWPDGAYHDDTLIKVDGVTDDGTKNLIEVADSAEILIESGIVFSSEDDRDGLPMETHFRRWKKAQNTVFLIIECPKEKESAVTNAIKAAGAIVRK